MTKAKPQTHAHRHGYDALAINQELEINLEDTAEDVWKLQKHIHAYGQKKGKKFATQKCVLGLRLFVRRIA